MLNQFRSKSRIASLTRVLLAVTASLVGPHLCAQAAPAPWTPEEATVKLNPFVVVPDEESYRVTSATSATRLATAIADIPQSVIVVSAAEIRDFKSFTFKDLFNYTPGVTFRLGTTDIVSIHGFVDQLRYRNGFTTPAYLSDTANIERVEVISGPAAAIAGKSNTGGYVNIETKQPTGADETNVDIVVGSYEYFRGVIDTGGRAELHNGQSLDYRIIAERSQGGGWRYNEDGLGSFGFFPSFRWNIARGTTLTLEGEFLDSVSDDSISPAYYPGPKGMVIPPGVKPIFNVLKAQWLDPRFNQNEAGMNRSQKPVAGYLTFVHSFNPNISFREGINYVRIPSLQQRVTEGNLPSYAISPDNIPGDNMFIGTSGDLMLARFLNRADAWTQTFSDQGDLSLRYGLGDFVDSRTLIGYIHEASSSGSIATNIQLNPISPFSPIYGMSGIVPTNPTTYSKTKPTDLFAYFLNEQLQLFEHRVILTYGFRRDEGQGQTVTNYLNGGAQTVTPKGANVSSPMYGAAVRPLPHLTVYGVYSEANAPSTFAFEFNTLPINDPKQVLLTATPVTTNKEFGIKTDLANNRLSLTASHYQIVQGGQLLNLNQAGTNLPYNQVVANTAKGFEVATYGRITDSIELTASYDYTKTTSQGIHELRGIAPNKALAYVKYSGLDLRDHPWSVRLGVQWQDTVWGDFYNSYRIPGATEIDSGLTFIKFGLTFDVAVKNITDIIFPLSTVSTDANTSETPREFILTISKHF